MTTTTRRLRSEITSGINVDAGQTPRIADIVPGSLIYRWATLRSRHLISEMPCHRDQMASVMYDPKTSMSVMVDQTVVCRRCFIGYAATPVPGTADVAWYRIVYRVTGPVAISRPRQPGE